jgi:lipopolysaccharide heptosyltransferase II
VFRKEPIRIEKILLIRFSSLGDIVMTTAMVRAVRQRFPQAKIHFVVREDFEALLTGNPHLDRIWMLKRATGWRGLLALGKRLRAERYDLVYDAHRSLRSRLMVPFLGAKYVRRFSKHYLKRSISLTFKVPRLLDSRRFLDRFVDPLRDLGVERDSKGPEVFATKAAMESALRKLSLSSPPREGWVGLIPSAQWPGKRWSEEGFRMVLLELLEKTPFSFVVFGGSADHFCRVLTRDLPPASSPRVFQAQGRLDLKEAISLLSTCHSVIANDTGLMHVADALGVPSVLIFGPTSNALGCAPFHPLTQVVETDLWCRPCSKNGEAPCIRAERYCLTTISPKQVAQAALHLYRQLAAVGASP